MATGRPDSKSKRGPKSARQPLRLIQVRPACPDDAPEILEVLCESIIRLCADDHQDDAHTLAVWLENKTIEKITTWIESPSTHSVVAVANDVLCGVGLIDSGGDLRLCYVLPGWDRQGVGRALLQDMEAQAHRWGLAEIRLTSSSRARAFYERHGYVASGPPGNPFGVLREYPYSKALAPPDAPAGDPTAPRPRRRPHQDG
jgi:GNAT superfamily N-acetyltransferase